MLPSKILVVDDSPEDRATIRRHLLKDNPQAFQIVETETGVDGWETLESTTPDCILLDFNLPDFEGIQFLESLLKAKGVWAPPVVLLTGQGNEALAVQAMKCGAHDYVPKENLEPLLLQHSIQRAITRAKKLREVETHHGILERSHNELQQLTSVLAKDLMQTCEAIHSSICEYLSTESQEVETTASHPLMKTQHAAQTTISLVQDLIDYMNMGKMTSSTKEPVELNSLVSHIVQSLGDQVQQNGATVDIDFLPNVQGYPSPLRQTFRHLIHNALQFQNIEPLQVHISAKPSGVNWQCSIRDNGKGITMDQLNDLFTSFSRQESDKHRAASGLGMAICKRAVDLHGGRIWAESQENEGTVIHFTIPQ